MFFNFMFYVLCFMFYVLCFMFYVLCFMFFVLCFMFYVLCFIFPYFEVSFPNFGKKKEEKTNIFQNQFRGKKELKYCLLFSASVGLLCL
jgi:hypothetical protein